jgi:hypothetical protein
MLRGMFGKEGRMQRDIWFWGASDFSWRKWVSKLIEKQILPEANFAFYANFSH